MEKEQQRIEFMNSIRRRSAQYLPGQMDTIEGQFLLLKQLADVIPPVRICIGKAEREYWPRVENRVVTVAQAARFCAQDINGMIRITKVENLHLEAFSEESLLKAWASLDYYSGKMDGSGAVQLRAIYVTLADELQKKAEARESAKLAAAAENARKQEEARIAAERARMEEEARIAAEKARMEEAFQKSQPEAEVQQPDSEDEEMTSFVLLERPEEKPPALLFVDEPEENTQFEPEVTVFEPLTPPKKKKPDLMTDGKRKLSPLLLLPLVAVILLLILLPMFSKSARVERQIDKIGTVSLDSGEAIAAAEESYNALSEKQQSKVENYDVLTEARTAYDCLVTEEAIDAIGSVSMESEAAIEAAEKLYDALPEEAKGRIRNDSKLTSARKAFDEIEAKVNETIRAIDAIGEVTLDSGDKIRSAREAYDALGKHSTAVADRLKTLTDAEAAYERCVGEDLYSKGMELSNAGKYEEALEQFVRITKEYSGVPAAAEAKTASNNCRLKLAEKATQKGDQYTAMQWLDQVDQAYRSMDSYKTLHGSIVEKLERARPRSGQKFGDKVGWGWCEMKVTAGKTDVCLRIVSKEDASKVTMVYLRAGETIEVNVKDGDYTLYVTSGQYWFNKDVGFGDSAKYQRAKEVLEMSTRQTGNVVHYYVYNVNLGNPSECYFTFTNTNASEFWK